MPTRKVVVWILLSFFTVTAARAQQERIALPGTQLRVEEVIETIQRQTDYIFAFDRRAFDVTRTVQAASADPSVGALLELITTGTGYSWLQRGAYLVIHPVPRRDPPPVPKARTDDIYRPSDPGADDAFRFREQLPSEPLSEEPPASTAVPVRPTSPVELPPPFSDYRHPDLYAAIRHNLPRGAVKSNLLYGAVTLTPNLGAEWALGPRSTLEFTGSWNQRNHEGRQNGNKKLNHGIARLEYRRWFCERYNGHFVGVHLFAAKYNVGGYSVPTLFDRAFRYEGVGFGGGLTYGYHLPLSKRWGVEFHAGVGVAQLDYIRFECPRCGNEIDRPSRTWFGPTRAGVSLVYLIR